MKPAYLSTIIFILLTTMQVCGQTILSGNIYNSKQEPIGAASISIKNTNSGVLADTAGHYQLITHEKGKRTIQVSSIGYRTKTLIVILEDTAIHLDITLQESAQQLGPVVVVSAGTFEASDKAKGAALTPMDAVTVAGSGADIANALRSLPGAQRVGESEGLYVRGGTSEETKQFIDGAVFPNPNYSSVPGILQPARVNPFLFKGILFSTGGYSALYGQALSSALILESVDLPDKTSASFSIFPANQAIGFEKLAANKKSSFGASAGYSNAQWYNRIVPQHPDYFHGPAYLSGDANFRIKTSETGMLKFYTNYGYNHVGMRNADIDSTDLLSSFQVKGTNLYANLSYRESWDDWRIDAVTAYNYYKGSVHNQLLNPAHEIVLVPDDPYSNKNSTTHSSSNYLQSRVVLSKRLANRQMIRFGAEYTSSRDPNNTSYPQQQDTYEITDHLVATFAETDVYLKKNTAAKIGVRAEYSSFLNKWNLAPRVSIAHKFTDGGQINMAYGIFFQKPGNIYLSQNNMLDYLSATHYIINYQKKAFNRLFRVEAFYKQYQHLISTLASTDNSGDGYAKGVEFFFRDKKTFKNLDYWVTYSYLDTKRQYLNYPYRLQPSYTTPHTLSIAIKKFFPDLSLITNVSYFITTGRPYYDLRKDGTGKTTIHDNGITQANNSMNILFAYLFSVFKNGKHKDYSGVAMGANNVFGNRQIFGYNYSYNGTNKVAITLPASRYYFIGFFMTLGMDRRSDLLNETYNQF